MGLGKSDAYVWKGIITSWFPSVEILPEEHRSDVTIVIEDMCLRFYNYMSASDSPRTLFREIRNHPGKIFAKFPNCVEYVCLIDDTDHVPASKRPTQNKRDDEQFSEEELRFLGKRAYLSQLCEDETDWIEAIYGQEAKDFNERQKEKGNKERRNAFKVFINKLMKTRSGNRKLDVYHTVGRELLKVHKNTFSLFGLERKMILDGCALPADPNCRRLIKDDDDIILDEFLAYVPGKSYPTNNVVMDSKRKYRNDGVRYALGEVDVKLVGWLIALLSKCDTPQTVWICCYDTDAIPILLLNMYKLIDKKTGHIPHQIFLDLTYRNANKVKMEDLTKEDQEKLKKHPELISKWTISTTVWDMVALWRHIHGTFGRCFPGIKRPVEIFCTLLVLGATDFVTRLTDVGISPLWEAFRIGGYSLLNDAIKTKECEGSKIYHHKQLLDPPREIWFDEEALLSFVQYLYMLKLTSAHNVKGHTLGFDATISKFIENSLLVRVKGKRVKKEKLRGLRDYERELTSILKKREESKNVLLVNGGNPLLTKEEAETMREYFRLKGLYSDYYAKETSTKKARRNVRRASSHSLRVEQVHKTVRHLIPPVEYIINGYTEAGERKKSLKGKVIPSEEELRGYVRRACWNIDYWYRGWHPSWEDRSLDKSACGKSISGWTIVSNGEESQGGNVSVKVDITNSILPISRPKKRQRRK